MKPPVIKLNVVAVTNSSDKMEKTTLDTNSKMWRVNSTKPKKATAKATR